MLQTDFKMMYSIMAEGFFISKEALLLIVKINNGTSLSGAG